MSAYVLDTHALIFYAGGRRSKLGRAASRAFEQFERQEACLYIPVPVVIETWQLALNGTIRLPGTLEAWWAEVESDELVHVELDADDVLRAASLDWEHDDIFDRLIVATALRLEAPLLTKDAAISDWGGVETVW
jgi:PIN domain nuclease of toxin-antitoxin system